MRLDEITRYLHDHIPITRSLGARVEHADGQSVRLWAPLAQNLNHRDTAFGGSLSSLAILSGWVLLYLRSASGASRPGSSSSAARSTSRRRWTATSPPPPHSRTRRRGRASSRRSRATAALA